MTAEAERAAGACVWSTSHSWNSGFAERNAEMYAFTSGFGEEDAIAKYGLRTSRKFALVAARKHVRSVCGGGVWLLSERTAISFLNS